jgi:hypothetical protein
MRPRSQSTSAEIATGDPERFGGEGHARGAPARSGGRSRQLSLVLAPASCVPYRRELPARSGPVGWDGPGPTADTDRRQRRSNRHRHAREKNADAQFHTLDGSVEQAPRKWTHRNDPRWPFLQAISPGTICRCPRTTEGHGRRQGSKDGCALWRGRSRTPLFFLAFASDAPTQEGA